MRKKNTLLSLFYSRGIGRRFSPVPEHLRAFQVPVGSIVNHHRIRYWIRTEDVHMAGIPEYPLIIPPLHVALFFSSRVLFPDPACLSLFTFSSLSHRSRYESIVPISNIRVPPPVVENTHDKAWMSLVFRKTSCDARRLKALSPGILYYQLVIARLERCRSAVATPYDKPISCFIDISHRGCLRPPLGITGNAAYSSNGNDDSSLRTFFFGPRPLPMCSPPFGMFAILDSSRLSAPLMTDDNFQLFRKTKA